MRPGHVQGQRRDIPPRVGELRPSQMLYAFGVGSLVDLPRMSVIVMGTNEWDPAYLREVAEDRLLAAVRHFLGPQVGRLCAPPIPPNGAETDGRQSGIGVPVETFPRWLRCSRCDLIAPVNSGIFRRNAPHQRPDLTEYVHQNCPSSQRGIPARVLPVRFLLACENGHLDDFPWVSFAHRGSGICDSPILRLREFGATGEASDITVKCDTCNSPMRRMAEAFGEDAGLPECAGRHPHLRMAAGSPCQAPQRTMLLGASNGWFSVSLSAVALSQPTERIDELVARCWSALSAFPDIATLSALRRHVPDLAPLAEYSDAEVWAATARHRTAQNSPGSGDATDLKTPEWDALTHPETTPQSRDFRLQRVAPPAGYEDVLEDTILVPRLREARALIGFTRVKSPGDFGEGEPVPQDRMAPLCTGSPVWAPAGETRGEGLFLRVREDAVEAWSANPAVRDRVDEFREAHRRWRQFRGILPADAYFPGVRYLLVHALAHALMRQVVLECGYSAASVRERVYAVDPNGSRAPMAGVLIYTAAPDSEGTLGGLVSLGRPDVLGRLLDAALEDLMTCSSDPLCSEHGPLTGGLALHGAACHACLFVPETSCERGNKLLDRSLLVETMDDATRRFFPGAGQ